MHEDQCGIPTMNAEMNTLCLMMSCLFFGQVSVIAPNVPEMYEAHFGIPMTGAVINAINTRLDAKTVAVILRHGEAQALFVHVDFVPLARDALHLLKGEVRARGVVRLLSFLSYTCSHLSQSRRRTKSMPKNVNESNLLSLSLPYRRILSSLHSLFPTPSGLPTRSPSSSVPLLHCKGGENMCVLQDTPS